MLLISRNIYKIYQGDNEESQGKGKNTDENKHKKGILTVHLPFHKIY